MMNEGFTLYSILQKKPAEEIAVLQKWIERYWTNE
jgi:hypothetical protein